MLKICLMSDNHGDEYSLRKVLSDNPACDYYIHCGDSLMSEDEIRPFISVKGNNDWQYDFPNERILDIGGHKILVLHGHRYTYSYDLLASKAKENGCDTIFYGHTHMFNDETYDGIRMINPGSTNYNRDFSEPCYAIVTIEDDGTINVKRVNLIGDKYVL
jgi:uncharacterized protein